MASVAVNGCSTSRMTSYSLMSHLRRVHTQHLSEVIAHWLLQLLVAARLRVAVGAPPLEVGRVPEPVTLHRVVLDLEDALGTKRCEGQVLAGTPAALGARHAVG